MKATSTITIQNTVIMCGIKMRGPAIFFFLKMAAVIAAALLLLASANAFQAPAALRTRPCLGLTVLAAGFGPPKQSKPGNPAPAKVSLF